MGLFQTTYFYLDSDGNEQSTTLIQNVKGTLIRTENIDGASISSVEIEKAVNMAKMIDIDERTKIAINKGKLDDDVTRSKTTADIALINEKTVAEKLKNGGVRVVYTYSYTDSDGTAHSGLTTSDLTTVHEVNGRVDRTEYTSSGTGRSVYDYENELTATK